ncbi:MAG: phage holin family protein [Chthoniobacterales bacterium]
MTGFIIRWLITTVAVFTAAHIIPGISYGNSWLTLLAASLLLGIINALIRPILLILSIPFILVTMGFFILVINALLLWFVSALLPSFQVDGFWSAFFGAIVVSIVSWLMSIFFRDSTGKVHTITHHGKIREKEANARVIENPGD